MIDDRTMGSNLAAEVRDATRAVAAAFGVPTERVDGIVQRLVREALEKRFRRPGPREVIARALDAELRAQQAEARKKFTPEKPARRAGVTPIRRRQAS
jgi:hypothetical protein